MKHRFNSSWMTILGLAFIATNPVYAADTTTIELNSIAQTGDACRLTFTASAPLGLEALETQTVLFDTAGAVDTFTVFDFGQVPQNGLRVRQFDVPQTQCDEVSLILFNGIERCATQTGANCAETLTFSSRIATVEVQQ